MKNRAVRIIEENDYRISQNSEFKILEIQQNNKRNGNDNSSCIKYTDYKNRRKQQTTTEMRMKKLEKERDIARNRQYADSQMTFAPSFFLGPPLSFQVNGTHPNSYSSSDATSSCFNLPNLGPHTPGHFGTRNYRPRHQMFPHRFSDHHSISPSFAYNNDK